MIFLRQFRTRRYYRYSRQVPGAMKQRIVRGMCLLVAVILSHSAAMVIFEEMSYTDALWLTMTTATTVGYGDTSASTDIGRLFTVGLMYILGIFLLGQVATDFIDYRVALIDRKRIGTHKWKDMKEHLLIINSPSEQSESYLPRLVAQVRATPALDDIPIQLLTTQYPSGLPDTLVKDGVTLHSGIGESDTDLDDVNVKAASFIFIMARDANDRRQDAMTYDVMSRLHDMETKATIIAEVVDDVNRQRILKIGATTVIRPVRAYPELVVRAMVEPGTEQVLEQLFTHQEDRLVTFDVEFSVGKWRDLLTAFIDHNNGIPMGYISDGTVYTNPPPSEACSGDSIIILVDESIDVTDDSVKACCASLAYSR